MNQLLENFKDKTKSLPDLRPGDKIRVYQKITEGGKQKTAIFEGRIIAIKGNRRLDGTFTVRKIAEGGIGVEKIFPWQLPSIIKIERLRSSKVHRSKLYFLRDFPAKKLKRLKEKDNRHTWEEAHEAPETPQVKPEKEEEEEAKEEVKETITEQQKNPDEAKPRDGAAS